MNKSQITDLVKSMGAIVGTYVVAKGYIPIGVWNDLLQIIILIVSAGFGIRANSTPALLTAVSESPEVKKIILAEEIVTPELVKQLTKNPKVQAAAPGATIWLG